MMLLGRILRPFLCLAFLSTIACERHSRNVTLSVLGFGLDAGEALRRDALEDFTRNTGIGVDLIPAWGTSAEQLAQTQRLLAQHSATPDVYLIDVIWPGTLGRGLLDLTHYRDEDSRSHLPSLLANDTVEGRLVSLPFYMNAGVLYYRTDLLHKYGYSRPADTWDELAAMAARIQKGERAAGKPDFWGYVWQGAPYEGLTCNALEWQASTGGGRILEDGGLITVNNPRTVQALRMASSWIGTISPASVLSYTEADSLTAFRSGNAAFLRHWSSGLSSENTAGSPIESRYGAARIPAGPAGRVQSMGGFHLAVSRYSLHPFEASQLVLYLTGGGVQLRRALARGALPTIPRLLEDPVLFRALPIAAALRDAGDGSWVARPSTIAGSHYAEVSRDYYQAVHSVLSGKSFASDAMAALEKQLSAIEGLSKERRP